MAPKYDEATQKWSPTTPEDGPEAGYGPTKTFLLHGPKPFLQRIFTPDDYEQTVYKFMAGEKCSRDVAQGNMDAYFRSKLAQRSSGTRNLQSLPRISLTVLFSSWPSDPPDWAYNRMEEEKKGIKIDYTKLDSKTAIKTVVWSVIVVGLVGRTIYSITTGESFNLH
jgi:hypothetical protein